MQMKKSRKYFFSLHSLPRSRYLALPVSLYFPHLLQTLSPFSPLSFSLSSLFPFSLDSSLLSSSLEVISASFSMLLFFYSALFFLIWIPSNFLSRSIVHIAVRSLMVVFSPIKVCIVPPSHLCSCSMSQGHRRASRSFHSSCTLENVTNTWLWSIFVE